MFFLDFLSFAVQVLASPLLIWFWNDDIAFTQGTSRDSHV